MESKTHLLQQHVDDYAKQIQGLKERIAELEKPIDMLIFCPECHMQHVDAPEPDNGWDNPPHKRHLCHGCRIVFPVAKVATNGVLALDGGD